MEERRKNMNVYQVKRKEQEERKGKMKKTEGRTRTGRRREGCGRVIETALREA